MSKIRETQSLQPSVLDRLIQIRGQFAVSKIGRAETKPQAGVAHPKKPDFKKEDEEKKKGSQRWLN